MTTPADAIKSALDTNWNVGTGGTKPTLAVTEDITQRYPDSQETIVGRTWTYRHREIPVNSTFVHRFHDITFRVSTSETEAATKREDRLTEMVDEVKRIFRANGVTGFHVARVVTVDQSPSDKSRSVFRADLGIHLIEYLVNAATVAGSTVTSTMTVDELTVNTSIAGSPTAALGDIIFKNAGAGADPVLASNSAIRKLSLTGGFAVTGALTVGTEVIVTNAGAGADPVLASDSALQKASLTGKFDITSVVILDTAGDNISSTNIADLLMFGSANKVYVNCIYWGTSQPGKMKTDFHYLTNVDETNQTLTFQLPIPTVRGSLGLHIDEIKIGLKDADADDYLDAVFMYGYSDAGTSTSISVTDGGDNQTSPGIKTYAIASTDVSGYVDIKVALVLVCTDANDIDISWVRLQCWYE